MRKMSILIGCILCILIFTRYTHAFDEIIRQEDEAIIAHLNMLEALDLLKDENFDVIEQEEVEKL